MKKLSVSELSIISGGRRNPFKHGWTGRSYMFIAPKRAKAAFGRAFIKSFLKTVK